MGPFLPTHEMERIVGTRPTGGDGASRRPNWSGGFGMGKFILNDLASGQCAESHAGIQIGKCGPAMARREQISISRDAQSAALKTAALHLNREKRPGARLKPAATEPSRPAATEHVAKLKMTQGSDCERLPFAAHRPRKTSSPGAALACGGQAEDRSATFKPPKRPEPG
jgi:hypothetical protein